MSARPKSTVSTANSSAMTRKNVESGTFGRDRMAPMAAATPNKIVMVSEWKKPTTNARTAKAARIKVRMGNRVEPVKRGALRPPSRLSAAKEGRASQGKVKCW